MTENCGVKKECDEFLATQKLSKSYIATTSTLGDLCHITEKSFVDAASNEIVETEIANSGNNTNEDALLYFVQVSNHFLCLVKNSPEQSDSVCLLIKFPVVLSGDGKTTL